MDHSLCGQETRNTAIQTPRSSVIGQSPQSVFRDVSSVDRGCNSSGNDLDATLIGSVPGYASTVWQRQVQSEHCHASQLDVKKTESSCSERDEQGLNNERIDIRQESLAVENAACKCADVCVNENSRNATASTAIAFSSAFSYSSSLFLYSSSADKNNNMNQNEHLAQQIRWEYMMTKTTTHSRGIEGL